MSRTVERKETEETQRGGIKKSEEKVGRERKSIIVRDRRRK
jgi:hypothetical protein